MENVEYSEGSVRELWKTSMPLMFSWLSCVMMVFVDRLYLAHYSTEALSSAVAASMMVWAFAYGFQILCEMAEVFVAQYNGAKRYGELGRPVWQMIWVGLLSFAFFIPLGIWGSDLLFSSGEEFVMRRQYFQVLIYFGPFFGLMGAASAFYMGRGKTAVITYIAIIGNVVNLILDPLFIFGVEGIIPSYGVQGAAFATGIGCAVQALIFFGLFLSKENRENYGTGNWTIDFDLMKKCLCVGAPPALFLVLELVGWGFFYAMMHQASTTHILVAGICQSIMLLLMFYGIGLEKGVAAVAGNLIGAGRFDRIPRLLRSAFYLLVGYSALTFIPMIVYPDFMIYWFLNNPENLEMGPEAVALGQELDMGSIMALIKVCLAINFFYLVFENVRWIISGILIASADTLFLMLSGVAMIWVFLVPPIYFLIVKRGGSIELATILLVFYAFVAAAIVWFRYASGKWQSNSLVDQDQDQALPEAV